MKIKAIVTLALCTMLFGGAVLTASAAPDPSAIGMVDLDRILNEYEKKKQLETEIQNMVRSMQDKLELRGRYKFLTEAELKELETLKFKTSLSTKEKARLAELDKLERDRDDEVRTLEGKSSPTEADKAKLNEMRQRAKESQQNTMKLAADYKAEVDTKRKEIGDKFINEVKAAIEVLAKEKTLSVVLDKRAILVGGTDLTDPLLKRLNKK